MGLVIEVLLLSNKSHLFSIIRTVLTQSVMDMCRASISPKLYHFKRSSPIQRFHTIDSSTIVHCASSNNGVAPLISVWYRGRILVCCQIMRRKTICNKNLHIVFLHSWLICFRKQKKICIADLQIYIILMPLSCLCFFCSWYLIIVLPYKLSYNDTL